MDAETFKRIFLPYSSKLYGIAYRIMQNKSLAEEVVQETFIKLWTKRHTFEDVRNHESFAVVILKNTCLDFLRKEKGYYENEKDICENHSLLSYIEQQDQINCVKNFIEKLPFRQRQVMQLKHWEGFSDKEIEEITGLTVGNIKMILSRTRKAIKEKFNNWEL